MTQESRNLFPKSALRGSAPEIQDSGPIVDLAEVQQLRRKVNDLHQMVHGQQSKLETASAELGIQRRRAETYEAKYSALREFLGDVVGILGGAK